MINLILVSIIWSFSFPLIKGILTGIDSNFVAFVRLFLALLVFIPFLRFKTIQNKQKLQLLGIGGIQFGLMYSAYIATYNFLPAHVIALLTTTTPIFITFFNDLFDKKLRIKFLLTASLAVLAGIIIKYPTQSLTINLKGVLLIQASNAFFAFGQVSYKRLMNENKITNTQAFSYLYLGATAITFVLSLFLTDFSNLKTKIITIDNINLSKQIITLLYLGVISSGLCFFLWNKGARNVSKGTLAIMNNVKIPLAIIASILLLHENVNYLRLIAGILLMALALVINFHFELKNKQPTQDYTT